MAISSKTWILWVFLAGLTVSGCDCTTLDPGYVGVETSWGKVTGQTYSEGFHMHSLSSTLHPISIRLQNLEEQDIPCRSRDNVGILVDVTISYALQRAGAASVYRQLGEEYAPLVILPAMRSTVRDAVASLDALSVAQARSTLEANIEREIRRSIETTLRNQRLPVRSIRIDSVQLRNVDLPESLRESIESIQRQRNMALEREQALQTAQQEAERIRVEAEGRNRVAILEAQRQAEVRRIAGESEANYNRVVSASLTPSLVELRRIDAQRAIVSNPNAHLVVVGGDGRPGGSTPLVIQSPR